MQPPGPRIHGVQPNALTLQTFRTERVFAGIIVIGFIGVATDLGFRLLRRRLMPWYRETDG